MASMLIGSALLARGGQCSAVLLLWRSLGILTSLIGAPFFVYLLFKGKEGLDMKLEIKNVSCGYRKEGCDQRYFFYSPNGEIFCLLGPNGVGKLLI